MRAFIIGALVGGVLGYVYEKIQNYQSPAEAAAVNEFKKEVEKKTKQNVDDVDE